MNRFLNPSTYRLTSVHEGLYLNCRKSFILEFVSNNLELLRRSIASQYNATAFPPDYCSRLSNLLHNENVRLLCNRFVIAKALFVGDQIDTNTQTRGEPTPFPMHNLIM